MYWRGKTLSGTTGMRPWLAGVGFLLFAVVQVGCGDSKIAGGVVDGPRIFRDACARCHGPEGIPTPGNVARTGVKSLQSQRVRNELSDDAIRQQILRGSANKSMPSFQGALSKKQLQAVVAHVRMLSEKAEETQVPSLSK